MWRPEALEYNTTTSYSAICPAHCTLVYDSGSDFHSGIVGVGGIVQWVIVGKDGIIVEVMEVVGVEGSRV